MSDARSNSYITLNQRKPFKVVVCAITLVAFFVNTFAYDLAWAGGTPSELTSVGSDRATGSGLSRELDPATFKLPDSLGTIKDSWKPNASTLRRGQLSNEGLAQGEYGLPRNTTVIHIQDAHCNYYAQTKIAEIVEYLNREYGINTINLEGGAMGYDLSPFTDIKDKALRAKASDHFVMEGLVNGAERFAVNNPEKVTLWGIEDPKLYTENLRIYTDSIKNKNAIDKHIKSLNMILSGLKTRIYSKELFEFDLKYGQYKAGNLEFKDYLSYLIQKAREKSVDIKKLTDVYLLSQALDEESKIGFERANNERDSLIDVLQKKVSKRIMEELVVKSVEFKADKISQKDYYAYLAAKAAVVKVDLKDYPELQKYIVYISMYDAINKANVMDEIGKLEDEIKKLLYQTNEEIKLSELSKNLALLKNIFGISITRQDYEYYKKNEESFSVRNYTSFITNKAPPHGIIVTLDENIRDLDKYREDMARFFEYSLKRDVAFLRNIRLAQRSMLTAHSKNNNLPATSHELSANHAAILITGGFHTDNLAELFKANNIAYVSIMPNFRNCEGYVCPYYKLLSGEKNMDLNAQLPAVLNTALALKSPLCPGINGGNGIPFKQVAPIGGRSTHTNIVTAKPTVCSIMLPDGSTIEIAIGEQHRLVIDALGEIREELIRENVNEEDNGIRKTEKTAEIDRAMAISIGGGFVRSLWYGGFLSDLDIVIPKSEYADSIIKRLSAKTGLSIDILDKSDAYNGDPLKEFRDMSDFTINKAILHFEKNPGQGEAYKIRFEEVNEGALEALRARTLIPTHIRPPSEIIAIRGLLRAMRFIATIEGLKLSPESDTWLRYAAIAIKDKVRSLRMRRFDDITIYEYFNLLDYWKQFDLLRKQVEAIGPSGQERLNNIVKAYDLEDFITFMDDMRFVTAALVKYNDALVRDKALAMKIYEEADIRYREAQDILARLSLPAALTSPSKVKDSGLRLVSAPAGASQAAVPQPQTAQTVTTASPVTFASDVKFDNVGRMKLSSGTGITGEEMVKQLVEAVGADIKDSKFSGAKSIVIKNISFAGSGGFKKAVLRIEAEVDGKTEIFGLRIMYAKPRPHATSIFDGGIRENIEYTRNEVELFKRFKELNGVGISIDRMINLIDIDGQTIGTIKEKPSLDKALKANNIYSVTVGEFADGDTIGKMGFSTDAEMDAKYGAYEQAVRTVIKGWLLTLDPRSGQGVAITDMKGDNFVRCNPVIKGKEPVVYVDLGNWKEMDMNRLFSLLTMMFLVGSIQARFSEREIRLAIISNMIAEIEEFLNRDISDDARDTLKEYIEVLEYMAARPDDINFTDARVRVRMGMTVPLSVSTAASARVALHVNPAHIAAKAVSAATAVHYSQVLPETENIAELAHSIRAEGDGQEPLDIDFSILKDTDKEANRQSAELAASLVRAAMAKNITLEDMIKALNDAVSAISGGQKIAEKFVMDATNIRESNARRFVLESGISQHDMWIDRKKKANQKIDEKLAGAFEGLDPAQQKKDLNFTLAAVRVIDFKTKYENYRRMYPNMNFQLTERLLYGYRNGAGDNKQNDIFNDLIRAAVASHVDVLICDMNTGGLTIGWNISDGNNMEGDIDIYEGMAVKRDGEGAGSSTVFKIDHHDANPNFDGWSTTPMVVGWLTQLHRKAKIDDKKGKKARAILKRLERSFAIANHQDVDMLLSNYLLRNATNEGLLTKWGAVFAAAALLQDHAIEPDSPDMLAKAEDLVSIISGITEESETSPGISFEYILSELLPAIAGYNKDPATLEKINTYREKTRAAVLEREGYLLRLIEKKLKDGESGSFSVEGGVILIYSDRRLFTNECLHTIRKVYPDMLKENSVLAGAWHRDGNIHFGLRRVSEISGIGMKNIADYLNRRFAVVQPIFDGRGGAAGGEISVIGENSTGIIEAFFAYTKDFVAAHPSKQPPASAPSAAALRSAPVLSAAAWLSRYYDRQRELSDYDSTVISAYASSHGKGNFFPITNENVDLVPMRDIKNRGGAIVTTSVGMHDSLAWNMKSDMVVNIDSNRIINEVIVPVFGIALSLYRTREELLSHLLSRNVDKEQLEKMKAWDTQRIIEYLYSMPVDEGMRNKQIKLFTELLSPHVDDSLITSEFPDKKVLVEKAISEYFRCFAYGDEYDSGDKNDALLRFVRGHINGFEPWCRNQASVDYIREMYQTGRIIGVSGNVAGEALKRAGKFLAGLGVKVRLFYISNIPEWIDRADPEKAAAEFRKGCYDFDLTDRSYLLWNGDIGDSFSGRSETHFLDRLTDGGRADTGHRIINRLVAANKLDSTPSVDHDVDRYYESMSVASIQGRDLIKQPLESAEALKILVEGNKIDGRQEEMLLDVIHYLSNHIPAIERSGIRVLFASWYIEDPETSTANYKHLVLGSSHFNSENNTLYLCLPKLLLHEKKEDIIKEALLLAQKEIASVPKLAAPGSLFGRGKFEALQVAPVIEEGVRALFYSAFAHFGYGWIGLAIFMPVFMYLHWLKYHKEFEKQYRAERGQAPPVWKTVIYTTLFAFLTSVVSFITARRGLTGMDFYAVNAGLHSLINIAPTIFPEAGFKSASLTPERTKEFRDTAQILAKIDKDIADFAARTGIDKVAAESAIKTFLENTSEEVFGDDDLRTFLMSYLKFSNSSSDLAGYLDSLNSLAADWIKRHGYLYLGFGFLATQARSKDEFDKVLGLAKYVDMFATEISDVQYPYIEANALLGSVFSAAWAMHRRLPDDPSRMKKIAEFLEYSVVAMRDMKSGLTGKVQVASDFNVASVIASNTIRKYMDEMVQCLHRRFLEDADVKDIYKPIMDFVRRFVIRRASLIFNDGNGNSFGLVLAIVSSTDAAGMKKSIESLERLHIMLETRFGNAVSEHMTEEYIRRVIERKLSRMSVSEALDSRLNMIDRIVPADSKVEGQLAENLFRSIWDMSENTIADFIEATASLSQSRMALYLVLLRQNIKAIEDIDLLDTEKRVAAMRAIFEDGDRQISKLLEWFGEASINESLKYYDLGAISKWLKLLSRPEIRHKLDQHISGTDPAKRQIYWNLLAGADPIFVDAILSVPIEDIRSNWQENFGVFEALMRSADSLKRRLQNKDGPVIAELVRIILENGQRHLVKEVEAFVNGYLQIKDIAAYSASIKFLENLTGAHKAADTGKKKARVLSEQIPILGMVGQMLQVSASIRNAKDLAYIRLRIMAALFWAFEGRGSRNSMESAKDLADEDKTFLGNEPNRKEVRNVLHSVLKQLLRSITGKDTLPAALMDDIKLLNRIIAITSVYYYIDESEYPGVRQAVKALLTDFVNNKSAAEIRGTVFSREENIRERRMLEAAGCDPRLFDNGIEVTSTIFQGIHIQRQARLSIAKNAAELLEIAEKEGVITHEDAAGRTISDASEAEKFASGISKRVSDASARRIESVLSEIRQAEERVRDAPVGGKEKIRVIISKEPIDEASVGGYENAGCYAIDGGNQQMPPSIAFTANRMFARAYDEGGRLIGTVELALTDKGIVVYSGAYTSRPDLDMDSAWMEAWKVLAHWAPGPGGRVVVARGMAGWSAVSESGIGNSISPDRLFTAVNRKVIWDLYEDAHDIATHDEEGNAIYTINDGKVISKSDSADTAVTPYKVPDFTTERSMEEAPSPAEEKTVPAASAINWDVLAKKIIAAGLKNYLSIIKLLKSADMVSMDIERFKGDIKSRFGNISDTDLDSLAKIINEAILPRAPPQEAASAQPAISGTGSWVVTESGKYERYWAAPVETVVSLGFGFLVSAILSYFGFDQAYQIFAGAVSASAFFIGAHAFNSEARRNIFKPTIIGLGIGTAIVYALLASGNPAIAGLGVAATVILGGVHHYINNAVIDKLNKRARLLCDRMKQKIAEAEVQDVLAGKGDRISAFRGVADAAFKAAGHPGERFDTVIYPASGSDITAAVMYADNVVTVDGSYDILDIEEPLLINMPDVTDILKSLIREGMHAGLPQWQNFNDYLIQLVLLGADLDSLKVIQRRSFKGNGFGGEATYYLTTVEFKFGNRTIRHTHIRHPLRDSFDAQDPGDRNVEEVIENAVKGRDKVVMLAKAGAPGPLEIRNRRDTNALYGILPQGTVVVSDNAAEPGIAGRAMAGRSMHAVSLVDKVSGDLEALHKRTGLNYGYADNPATGLGILQILKDVPVADVIGESDITVARIFGSPKFRHAVQANIAIGLSVVFASIGYMVSGNFWVATAAWIAGDIFGGYIAIKVGEEIKIASDILPQPLKHTVLIPGEDGAAEIHINKDMEGLRNTRRPYEFIFGEILDAIYMAVQAKESGDPNFIGIDRITLETHLLADNRADKAGKPSLKALEDFIAKLRGLGIEVTEYDVGFSEKVNLRYANNLAEAWRRDKGGRFTVDITDGERRRALIEGMRPVKAAADAQKKAAVTETEDGVISFAAFNDGRNNPGYEKSIINGRTVFTVDTGGAILYHPKQGEEFSIITPSMINCTGIYIRATDAEGRVHYGMAHVLVLGKSDQPLREHIKYVHERLEEAGFITENIEYIVDYMPSSYGDAVFQDQSLANLNIRFEPRENNLKTVSFPEVAAQGVNVRQGPINKEPDFVLNYIIGSGKVWKWGEAPLPVVTKPVPVLASAAVPVQVRIQTPIIDIDEVVKGIWEGDNGSQNSRKLTVHLTSMMENALANGKERSVIRALGDIQKILDRAYAHYGQKKVGAVIFHLVDSLNNRLMARGYYISTFRIYENKKLILFAIESTVPGDIKTLYVRQLAGLPNGDPVPFSGWTGSHDNLVVVNTGLHSQIAEGIYETINSPVTPINRGEDVIARFERLRLLAVRRTYPEVAKDKITAAMNEHTRYHEYEHVRQYLDIRDKAKVRTDTPALDETLSELWAGKNTGKECSVIAFAMSHAFSADKTWHDMAWRILEGLSGTKDHARIVDWIENEALVEGNSGRMVEAITRVYNAALEEWRMIHHIEIENIEEAPTAETLPSPTTAPGSIEKPDAALSSAMTAPAPSPTYVNAPAERQSNLEGMGTTDISGLRLEASATAIPTSTVAERSAAVTEAFKDANGRSTDVRVVQGVPKGGMSIAQTADTANGISRTLAKNEYGVRDGTKQIYLFEIIIDDSEQTAKNMETAIAKANQGLASTGRVVIYAPQMDNGPKLADRFKQGANVTILSDAYMDYDYPDMVARMALARNISFYYESNDKEVLNTISNLLEKIAQGQFKLDAIDDLFKITIRIKPVDYSKDIDLWKNAQIATAIAA